MFLQLKLSSITFFFIFLFFSCNKKNLVEDKVLKVSDIKPSLVSNDHTSESLLFTLNNGTILHFFRLDPTIKGDHVGNGGRIVRRESNDNGATWSVPVTIYDDEWDDRNIRGGMTEDGTIILFFRRYDGNNWKPVDLNYIVSRDNGKTWTERTLLTEFQNFVTNFYEVWISNFTSIGGGKYLMPVSGPEYCEMKMFKLQGNKVVFDSKNFIFDYTKNHEYAIDEPYISVTPDSNKLICLFRDENHSTYYQSTTLDRGTTWTLPARTNIAESYFCPSPLIFYDDIDKNIITIATDRRHINSTKISDALESEIWIYSNKVEDVFTSTQSYKLLFKLDRPKPVEYMFYGYSAFTKMKNGQYLVIVSEGSFDGVNEDADLFQFVLNYKACYKK